MHEQIARPERKDIGEAHGGRGDQNAASAVALN